MLSKATIFVRHANGARSHTTFEGPREKIQEFYDTVTTGVCTIAKLFYVQDSDRPMYVFATDWQEAVEKWRKFIQKENPIEQCEYCSPNSCALPSSEQYDPEGIQLIADSDEIIL